MNTTTSLIPTISLILPHDLTDTEVMQAQNLSLLTIQHLENEKMIIVQRLVELTYTPKEKEDYGVQLAYMQGQLHMIEYLLASASEATEQQHSSMVRQAIESPADVEVKTIAPSELFKTIKTGENSPF